MESITLRERVRLTTSGPKDHLASFARDVADGLERRPKFLPCRYFYDRRGSALFEEITRLPEYYLTRAEREILTDHAADIVARVPGNRTLVELGSGSGVKTRILIESFLRTNGAVRYVPVDISRSAVEASAAELVEAYEALEVDAIVGEYGEALRHLEENDPGR